MKKTLLTTTLCLLTALTAGSQANRQLTKISHDYTYDGVPVHEVLTFEYDSQGRMSSSHCHYYRDSSDSEWSDIYVDETYAYAADGTQFTSTYTINDMDYVMKADATYHLSQGRVQTFDITMTGEMNYTSMAHCECEYDSQGHLVKAKTTNTDSYEEENYVTEQYYQWSGNNLTGMTEYDEGQLSASATFTTSDVRTNNAMVGFLFGGFTEVMESKELYATTYAIYTYVGSMSPSLLSDCTITEDDETAHIHYDYELDGLGDVAVVHETINGQATDVYRFEWGGEAAIDGISADVSTDAPCFSLSGQRTDTPTRGIYVRGGRKVVLK